MASAKQAPDNALEVARSGRAVITWKWILPPLDREETNAEQTVREAHNRVIMADERHMIAEDELDRARRDFMEIAAVMGVRFP